VDVAANGREAVEMIGLMPYDAVLMDCQMPEMDGYEATAEIRRRERETGRHVPIIAMTANAMQGDRDLCIDAGMDDYVAKPVALETLAATVHRWCDTPVQALSGTTGRAAPPWRVGTTPRRVQSS
jgi:CheY-like chemotaxis protein